MKIRLNFELSFNKLEKTPAAGCTIGGKHKLYATALRLVSCGGLSGKRYSTRKNYFTAIGSFLDFCGGDCLIEQMSPETMCAYQLWLKDRGLCLNAISCYMRSLRTVYNCAVSECGITDRHPFRNVFTGRMKTDKRSICEDDIRRIAALELVRGSLLERARDMFLFSFYAMGMPFVDMAFLRRSQIRNGQIVYHRRKTGQRVCIHVEPCMEEIMGRYSRHTASDYVFPILTGIAVDSTDAAYNAKLSQYNRCLRMLAHRAGVNALTSYTARHSWASIAYKCNVDLPVISKALGHTDTKTTLTYIREIDDTRLRQANSQIIKMLNET